MRAALRRLLGRHWWLGLTVAGWALLVFSTGTPRGFDRYGVQQIERIEGAREWLRQVAEGTSPFDPGAAREQLVADPYVGPVTGLLPAVVGRLVGGSPDSAALARLTNTLLICLAAWCLFSIGRRAGGLLAGLGAAVALIAVPRIWGAATAPGLTAAALAAMVLAAMCMAHARDRGIYVLPAVLALAAALLTTQLAWLLLFPWAYLTFFDARPSREGGWITSRALRLWAPFVFPAALVLAMWVFAPLREGGKEELANYLKAFVQLPREATLYLGEVYRADRLPWHASLVLTLFTTPPTVLFLALFGLTLSSPLTRWIRRWLRLAPSAIDDSPETRVQVEALRLSWSMVLLTLALPLLMGTTHSHGVDLLALTVPWLAIFAGIGLTVILQVIAVRLQRLFAGRGFARIATLAGLTTLGWGVFVFAFKDTQDSYPEVESYYNWLVNGLDGATELGLPRNPHGSPPPGFLTQLVEPGAQATIAVVPSDGSEWATLERYRQHGLISDGLTLAPLETAELLVFRFDELSADYYRKLPDFYALIRGLDPSAVRWIRRDGIPLFAAVRLDP